MRKLFSRSGAKSLVGCAAALSLALTAAPALATTNTPSLDPPCSTELTVANPDSADFQVAYMCVHSFWFANKDSMAWSSSFNFNEAMQDAASAFFAGEIDAATALADLLSAFDLIIPAGDPSGLTNLLGNYPDDSKKDDYTPESWRPCGAARTAAETALRNPGKHTQPEIDAMAAALILHCGALVPRANTSDLEDLLGGFPDDSKKDDYTPESWGPCGDARAAAEALLADPSNATQAEVDAAAAALKFACEALVRKAPPPPPSANKKELSDQISDADKLVEDLYTPESWADLVKARDAARAVANNPAATQAQVDAAVKALKDAVAALVLKPNLDPRASVVKVKAAQLTVTLARGQKMTVPAFGYNGYNKATKVAYSSSKPKIAKVSKKGKITARKVGKATVTVRTPNGLTLKIKVQVVAKKPATVAKLKVKVAGVKKSMKVGKVAYANVTFKPKNAVGVKVTFKSTKKSVVAVDKAGRLLAKKKGKATIIFKAGKATKKIKVTVK